LHSWLLWLLRHRRRRSSTGRKGALLIAFL
jgi:hypothetical protein